MIIIRASDGEWCAHCGVWFVSGCPTAYIEPVAAIPAHRGKGLARAAVYEAVNRAARLGATRAVVLSDQPFYTRLGFTPCGSFIRMVKEAPSAAPADRS